MYRSADIDADDLYHHHRQREAIDQKQTRIVSHVNAWYTIEGRKQLLSVRGKRPSKTLLGLAVAGVVIEQPTEAALSVPAPLGRGVGRGNSSTRAARGLIRVIRPARKEEISLGEEIRKRKKRKENENEKEKEKEKRKKREKERKEKEKEKRKRERKKEINKERKTKRKKRERQRKVKDKDKDKERKKRERERKRKRERKEKEKEKTKRKTKTKRKRERKEKEKKR